MEQDLTRGQKETLLVRELSNVGYGLMDPIDLQALSAILKQKSVVDGQSRAGEWTKR